MPQMPDLRVRQRALNDMIEPIDRQEQIDKTEPHDATEPTDRIDPTDPTDNTEPLEPMDRTEFSDHSDHLELLSTPRTESMLNAPHGAGFGALSPIPGPY
jgi:hypothetical protein